MLIEDKTHTKSTTGSSFVTFVTVVRDEKAQAKTELDHEQEHGHERTASEFDVPPTPRLVSFISALLCAKEGRCEIRRQGCSLEVNQRARRSSIRTCPWMELKLEQLLERPGCTLGGADSLVSSHLQAGVI
jgi:hypothetical protein